MSQKIKHKKKTAFRLFVEYGFHLWLLIFLVNVVVYYSIRFFISAYSPGQETKINSRVFDSPLTPTASIPVPTTLGPVVELSFFMPGVGTNGGNLKPTHTVRDVNVYLYDSDSNTADKSVKPLYTIKTQATYESDPNSPSYTLFVNKYVDLGVVTDAKYQIAIKTPQSLLKLIKTDSNLIGGELFNISSRRSFVLPPQTMITGDIYPVPEGDNFMDINDYNTLAACFGIGTSSPECKDMILADLDDNGVVDGIDYNIMLLNYRTLLSMGIPIPSIFVPQTGLQTGIDPFKGGPISSIKNPLAFKPTITQVSPTPAESSGGGRSFALVLVFFLFVALGVVGFVVYKLKIFKALFHKPENTQKQPAEAEQAAQTTPQQASPQAELGKQGDVVEKEGYLKRVSIDEVANGTWVTLADDSGITRGFVKGTKVTDGFVKIKGTMETDPEDKKYMLITEVNSEE